MFLIWIGNNRTRPKLPKHSQNVSVLSYISCMSSHECPSIYWQRNTRIEQAHTLTSSARELIYNHQPLHCETRDNNLVQTVQHMAAETGSCCRRPSSPNNAVAVNPALPLIPMDHFLHGAGHVGGGYHALYIIREQRHENRFS